MGHESGKNGGVYTSSLLIEDCEDEWTNDNLTSSVEDTADYKVGAASVKAVNPGTRGENKLLCHEFGLTLPLTDYDAMYLWLKDSVGVTLNELQMLLDDANDCLSPTENLQVRALTAGAWTQVFLPFADPDDLGSIVSVGLFQVPDLAARNTWMDDIRALKEIDGIKSWTLDYTNEALNTTDFGNSGVSAFIPGITAWIGTFEGYKEGIPLSIGSEVYLVLGETSTGSQCWIGKAIITGAVPSTDYDGIVSYSYTFQGTGALEEPST